MTRPRIDSFYEPMTEIERELLLATKRPSVHQVRRLEVTLRARESELLDWQLALQRLTPGGSEFQEPQQYVRFMERERASRHTQVLRMKAERDKLKVAASGAISLFELWRDGVFAKIGITWLEEPPAIVALRAALQPALETETTP